MRDNEKKSPSPGCHQEHVQVLNSLTESLKDELKRGLTLLDGCVNQLAQAKWILINVERTIENYYAECPACDKDAAGPPVGNRATTPPKVVTSIPTATTSHAGGKKVRESKAKKASVLPMVSGHTVQRPKINIARVDVRKDKKPKKEKEAAAASTSRVRSRGSGSTALALASASTSSGRPMSDSGDEAPRNGTIGPSPGKKKPGPMSKTRIKCENPPELTYDGACVSVNLDDVSDLLDGESFFEGTELNKFLKLVGLPLVKEKTKPAVSKSEKPSTSRASTSEELNKKRKRGSDDDSSEGEQTTKKLEEIKSKDDTDAPKTIPAPKLNIPIVLNQSIKAKFLDFAKAKINPKTDSGAEPKTSSKVESPKLKENVGVNSVFRKTESGSDDSESESRRNARKPSATGKKSKQDSGSESSDSPKKKKSKPPHRSSHKNSSSEDSDVEKASKSSKSFRKTKKKSSDDDSEPEYALSSPTSKKRSAANTSRTTGRRGAKVKSKETISSDSEDSGVSNQKKPSRRNRKASRGESSDERPAVAKKITKSPDRRSSKNDIQVKPKEDTPERRSNVGSKAGGSESDEPKPKPRPGPASAKAKRTGGRPGPLSAKLKAEKEKQEAEKMEVESSDDDGKKKSNKSDSKSQAMFTDSDSDDSAMKKIKTKIPLDLQDAARSPSPRGAKDLFNNLLANYNKTPAPDTPLSKLRKRSKFVSEEIFELKDALQDKLSEVGRELVPYMGPVDADGSVFKTGRYYIVGKQNDEKLVFFDSSQELQELDLSMEDVDELINE